MEKALAVLLTVMASCSVSVPPARSTAATLCPPEATITRTKGPTKGPLTKGPGEAFFRDASGLPVYLVGSHTWDSFQDWGDFRPDFDYAAYLDMMVSCGHNFMRLWMFEGPANEQPTGQWQPQMRPMPWRQVTVDDDGALDPNGSREVFDVDPSRMNPAFLERLVERVEQAGKRGIYVSVMLFQGWSVHQIVDRGGPDPWPSHPLRAGNSRQELRGRYTPTKTPRHEESGLFLHRLPRSAGSEWVTQVQEGYVSALYRALAQHDNVLWEVCNECQTGDLGSTNADTATRAWEAAVLDRLDHERRRGEGHRHPIGLTSPGFHVDNGPLITSIADWISPSNQGGWDLQPPVPAGEKVIVSDSDHLAGILNRNEPIHRAWIWRNATRGIHTIFMEPVQNPFSSQFATRTDPRAGKYARIRAHLGRARHYVDRMDLGRARSRTAGPACTSGYCLADDVGRQYLVYGQEGGEQAVRVAAGRYTLEWMRPADGRVVIETETRVVEAAGVLTVSPPPGVDGGDVVLYLRGEALSASTGRS